jgi:restriction system protein
LNSAGGPLRRVGVWEGEMPIPDYQSLMLPVLRSAGSDEISMSECRERVAKDLGLSDEDLAQRYPSGAGETVFANRVAWAKIYLTAAGVLDATRRGYFQISDEGRRLLVETLRASTMRFCGVIPALSRG